LNFYGIHLATKNLAILILSRGRKAMKKNVWIKFLMGGVFCLLIVMPSFVHADVTINSAETSMVDLETRNSGGSDRYATVTGSGSVITSDNDALWASVNGWNITVNGQITGSGGQGILFNSASDSSGNYLSGTVTNTGSIYGHHNGIVMGSGTVTNYGSGSITGNEYYSVSFINNGTGTAAGTVINAGYLGGWLGGINLYSGGTGTLSVVNTGLIDGAYDGIHFSTVGNGTVNVNNYSDSTIIGYNGRGIYIYSDGTLDATINNAGTIQSNYDGYNASGIYIGGYGGASSYTGTASITNSGTIQAYYDAVGLEYLASATINNSGTMVSEWSNGLYVYEVGTVTVDNSGTIRGEDYYYDEEDSGYPAVYIGYADTVNLTNSGTIEGYYYAGGIVLEEINSATITNNAGGRILSEWDSGIYAQGLTTLNMTNAGTIDGGYSGISIYDVGSSTITNSGTISADIIGIDIYGDETMSATITNNAGGLIEGYAGNGVSVKDVGTVTVDNAGTIRGGFEGVLINGSEFGGVQSVSVTNEAGGVIEGHGGYEGLAIYLNSYGVDSEGIATTATITNSGTITGDNAGASVFGDDLTTLTLTNNASGLIQGFDSGLNVFGVGSATVTNAGEISNVSMGGGAPGSGYGYTGGGYGGGYGIDMIYVGAANVDNSGTISAYDNFGYGGYGVSIIDGDTAAVTNSGDINAYGYSYGGYGGAPGGGYGVPYGYGVTVGVDIEYMDEATVTNSGTITATGGSGYTGPPAGGYTSGGYGGYYYGDSVGIGILNVTDTTINNSGTIIATAGISYGGDDSYDWGYPGYDGYGADGYGMYIIPGYGGYKGVGITLPETTVSVTNSGTITAAGSDGYGGRGGDGISGYTGYFDNGYSTGYSADGAGGYGGAGIGGDGYGISIEYANAANVDITAGSITGTGGDGYGGRGGSGDFNSGYGGYGGYGGFGTGGTGYGISIFSADTAPMTNSGTITGVGGDAYGGTGGTGYGYSGGKGGDSNGGTGFGVNIVNVTTATIYNNAGGTITGVGGNGYGGNGGEGLGLSPGYGGYGGNGGDAYGGGGYGIGIFVADTASVTNYGTINGIGGYGYGGNGGDDGYGGSGSYGEGYDGYGYRGSGTGVAIGIVTDATVYNYGTITGTSGKITDGGGIGYGVAISDADTAAVINSGTISGSFAGVSMDKIGHAEVTNNAGGLITGDLAGVLMSEIPGEETAVINNYGTIEGTGKYSAQMISISGYDYGIDSGEIAIGDLYGSFNIGEISGSAAISNFEIDYGIGVGIMEADTVQINNYAGGMISGGLLGVGIASAGDVDIYNAGTITSMGKGILNADMLSGEINYLNWDVYSFAEGPFFSVDIDYLSGYANGFSANVDYGIGIGIVNADNVTVYNDETGTIEGGILGIGIASFDLGTITGVGYVPSGTTATVYNYGTITGQGTGVIDAASLGGTIEVDCTSGHCSGGFDLQNVHGELEYGIGVGIFGMDTVNVYNYSTGTITGGTMGVGIGNMYLGSAVTGVGEPATGSLINVYNEGLITSTGSGSITVSPDDESYAFAANGQFGIGVGIYGMDEANVYNYTDGTITGGLIGVGMAGITDTANVYNYGTITAPGSGTISYSDATDSLTIEGNYGIGVGFYGNSITGLMSEVMPIAGMINNFTGNYILSIFNVPEVTPQTAVTVTNYGSITGGILGVGIADVASANVDNYGTISANGSIHAAYTSTEYPEDNFDETLAIGFGIGMAGAGNVTITNRTGATIAGSQMGIIVLGGNTTLTNNGTITGSGGTAVMLTGDYNTVTLGTGTEINGNILVGNASDAYVDALLAALMSTTPTGVVVDTYLNNHLYLDGMGSIDAGKLQGFNSLTKTGSGTWVLAGDQDFTAYNTTMPIAVNGGLLALSGRNTSAGVTASSLTLAAGTSLGYVVNASTTPIAPISATGALTLTGNANFNNGTIVVIPLAGDYAATTTYQGVLSVGGEINTPWTSVVSISALLTPTMVEQGTTNIYDLVLKRESFTTGASGGNVGLGADLDQLYEDATGDLRTILDQIVLLPTIGEVQRALSEVSGGAHTAFQLMSFSGLGKYLGVLNNHIGGGTGLANSMGKNSWYAENYPQGIQLAMAGGGSSMNDAMPIMLAMAGNLVGQGQIASGTNWGFWADGYAGVGNRRSDDIIAKYKQTLYGGMLGFDIRATDNLFIGISGGVSTTDLTFDDMQDNGNMDSYHGSLYMVYDGKPWYAEGILTYAYNKYDLERYITMGPAVAKSDYSGNEYIGYAEIGYKLNAGGVTIRPLAAFQADYLSQEAFTETGAGIYNLYVEKHNTGSYQSFLGVNISGAIKLGGSASLTPELRAKWAHEFSNEEHLISARFAGDSSGSWTVGPEALSRDTAILGAGLNLSFNKNVAAYIQYDAELNKDFINHTGLVGLRFAW
jgi:uncharacterized protein YhjY with autotransporter beta-barrel domain